MTTWRIVKFESPYLAVVQGPDTGGVEVGPVTRAEQAEAEVAELRAAFDRGNESYLACERQRDEECDRADRLLERAEAAEARVSDLEQLLVDIRAKAAMLECLTRAEGGGRGY